MNGLALARAYYETCGKPMIEAHFADVSDRIAVGLVGHGSECFGFDDTLSQDHDFAPGFCLWLTEEDDCAFGFRLFRAYRALPDTFAGTSLQQKSLRGANGRGVQTIREFYSFYTETGDIPENNRAWLAIPDFYLAEATNGAVFSDPVGEFTRIREGLLRRPADVRYKKLGSALFYMAQTGQYNYARCLQHGEKTAAAIALADFCRHTAEALFLLCDRYAPYYKWLFRALRTLPDCVQTAEALEQLLAAPYEQARNQTVIEEIAGTVQERLRRTGLCTCRDSYLEPYAYEIQKQIRDGDLRTLPVML